MKIVILMTLLISHLSLAEEATTSSDDQYMVEQLVKSPRLKTYLYDEAPGRVEDASNSNVYLVQNALRPAGFTAPNISHGTIRRKTQQIKYGKIERDGACYSNIDAPEKYKEVSEKVLVEPAQTKYVDVKRPAKYDYQRELVSEATEKFYEVEASDSYYEETYIADQAGTRIITIPAQYKTINGRRQLIQPTSYKTIHVGPRYGKVRYRTYGGPVIEKVNIPAQYKLVAYEVEPATVETQEVHVPAKYETVRRTVKIADNQKNWKQVLCPEKKQDARTIKRIQEALLAAGYSFDGITGVYSDETANAITRFQRNRGLASGALTMETVRALNVRVAP